MMRQDAIGGAFVYLEIVLSITSQLEQIQIECISEQYVGGGGRGLSSTYETLARVGGFAILGEGK